MVIVCAAACYTAPLSLAQGLMRIRPEHHRAVGLERIGRARHAFAGGPAAGIRLSPDPHYTYFDRQYSFPNVNKTLYPSCAEMRRN